MLNKPLHAMGLILAMGMTVGCGEEPTPNGTPTDGPTATPTAEVTPTATAEPTDEPTAEPTDEPTAAPTAEPTAEPTEGGETPEPTEGGETPEPTEGGETPEPTEGGETPEPTEGGETPEPTEGGETPEPTAGDETPYPLPSGLYINEVVSANDTLIMNSYGEYDDWIELYNGSDEIIYLHRFTLSDDPEELDKWEFPVVSIEAGQYLLIWASDEDTTKQELHASFKLKSDGEPVILSTPDGQIVDQVEAMEIPTDISYGRSPDGGETWELWAVPSPGAANGGEVYVAPEPTPDP